MLKKLFGFGKKAEKRAAASGCTFGAAGYGCPFVIKTV